jgi:hypothetical protein
MGFLEWVANASMNRCEYFIAVNIQRQVHELVHVLQDQHIAVQLHDTLVFGE